MRTQVLRTLLLVLGMLMAVDKLDVALGDRAQDSPGVARAGLEMAARALDGTVIAAEKPPVRYAVAIIVDGSTTAEQITSMLDGAGSYIVRKDCLDVDPDIDVRRANCPFGIFKGLPSREAFFFIVLNGSVDPALEASIAWPWERFRTQTLTVPQLAQYAKSQAYLQFGATKLWVVRPDVAYIYTGAANEDLFESLPN